MKTKLSLLIALITLLTVTQAKAQNQPQLIYKNTFPNAASVNDWTLSGVTWGTASNGTLTFANTSSTATFQFATTNLTNLVVHIVSGNATQIRVQTSPNGTTYTDQGVFTTGTTSKTLPNNTRYIRFESTATNATLRDVAITSNFPIFDFANFSTAMTANLSQWFSEFENDNTMQFTAPITWPEGSFQRHGAAKHRLFNNETYRYHTFGTVLDHSLTPPQVHIRPQNLNNDNATDFFEFTGFSARASDFKLHVVNEAGQTEIISFDISTSQNNVHFPVDYNSDSKQRGFTLISAENCILELESEANMNTAIHTEHFSGHITISLKPYGHISGEGEPKNPLDGRCTLNFLRVKPISI
jgi:hypothetical protein